MSSKVAMNHVLTAAEELERDLSQAYPRAEHNGRAAAWIRYGLILRVLAL